MSTNHYEIAGVSGDETVFGVRPDLNLPNLALVFNGRTTGVLTITVKVMGADRFVAPADNTIDLATTNTWMLLNCPVEEVTVDDAGSGAFGIVANQWGN
jgi:hypothetical protein